MDGRSDGQSDRANSWDPSDLKNLNSEKLVYLHNIIYSVKIWLKVFSMENLLTITYISTFWKKNAMIIDTFKMVPINIARTNKILIIFSASWPNLKKIFLMTLDGRYKMIITFCFWKHCLLFLCCFSETQIWCILLQKSFCLYRNLPQIEIPRVYKKSFRFSHYFYKCWQRHIETKTFKLV